VTRKNYSLPLWVTDAVFYQIFPDRFCNGDETNDPPAVSAWGEAPTRENFFGGDLQGVISKLDYLQDLGVNAIYLNPIFQARTNHRYDTSDYFKVDPMLGDKAVLKELVRQMHARGMHIIFDGVFNHCGDGFLPFQDVVRNGADSQYADCFLARSYPLTTEPLNFLSCGGCTYLPKFNHANKQVQQFILKVGRYWLEETGMDGWRLDVPFKINPSFWRQFRKSVKAVNPQAYLVGEVWREAAPWIKGDTFDGVTNYRLRDIIFDYVNTTVLDAEDFGYELHTLLEAHGVSAGHMLNLLDSHDTPRVLTTFNGDVDKLRIALTLQMTLPGAPMIYYGDELGLLGETDPDCRRCMPWDETQWNHQVQQFTRALTHLRQEHPALRSGKLTQLAFFNGVYAYKQELEEDDVIVIVNPRESISKLEIPTFSQHEKWMEYTSGAPVIAYDGRIRFDPLPASSALVLIKSN
jgi:cyclomaltodextrinase / maltogenic alpha-amylase / neopullulanase